MLVLVGCSTEAGPPAPTSTPRASPPAPASQEVTPTAPPDDRTSPPSLSDSEKSDAFWDAAVGSHAPEHEYESVEAMLEAVDLVVVGRVVDVRSGESLVEELPDGYPPVSVSFAYATLAVDDVIMGTPETSEPGTIQLRIPTASLEWTRSHMPAHDHVFLLRNGAEVMEAKGDPPEEAELWRNTYVTAGPGSVIRDIDGSARAIPKWAECCSNLFPATVDGEAFGSVVAAIRAAAGE